MHGQLSVIGVTIIAFLPTDIVQLVSSIACVWDLIITVTY